MLYSPVDCKVSDSVVHARLSVVIHISPTQFKMQGLRPKMHNDNVRMHKNGHWMSRPAAQSNRQNGRILRNEQRKEHERQFKRRIQTKAQVDPFKLDK
jgi:hypothetical protein